METLSHEETMADEGANQEEHSPAETSVPDDVIDPAHIPEGHICMRKVHFNRSWYFFCFVGV